MINEFHTKRMQKIIETAGGETLLGGKVNLEARHCEPTIIFEPNLDAEIMTDEIFGPILPIIPFRDMDECIDFINDRDKPLALYYFGNQNSANCTRVYEETSSGAFMTNDAIIHLVSHYQGFGGVGSSGYGRYVGWEGFQ